MTAPDRAGPRGLRLSRETIRMLRSDDLLQAASGCDTPSLTTEQTDSFSVVNCTRTNTCI